MSDETPENKAFSPYFDSLMPIAPAGPDVEANIAFFEKELGFKTLYKEDAPANMAIVKRDGVEIFLQKTNDAYWASQTAYRIRVKNVTAYYEQLVAQGCKAIHPNGKLQKKPWGSTEFAVLVPFGVCITVYEFIK